MMATSGTSILERKETVQCRVAVFYDVHNTVPRSLKHFLKTPCLLLQPSVLRPCILVLIVSVSINCFKTLSALNG